jgi:flavodoxin
MGSDKKVLVVYFSHEGNTKFVAEKIAKLADGDILELIPKKPLAAKEGVGKFFWGGSKVYMRTKPELKKFKIDPTDYDVLFIGTPVWAWTFAPPLRTFFSDVELKKKKIALFACDEGGLRQTFEKMKKELPGNEFLGEIDFFAPVKTGKERKAEKELAKWVEKVLKKV